MKLLEERIRKDGVVKPGNVLKVDSFLNHQMDVIFFNEMAKEFKRLYEGVPINKILTIEASGIGIAIMAGLHLEVPVVFAKKSRSSNISETVCARRAIVWNHWPSSTAWIRKQERSRSAAVKTDCGFLLPCLRRHCE